jgi:hypothetical protein
VVPKLDDRISYPVNFQRAVFDSRYEDRYDVDGKAKRTLFLAIGIRLLFSISRHGFTYRQPHQILLDRGCEIAVAQLSLQRGVTRGNRCGNHRRWLRWRIDSLLDQQSV